MEAEIAFIVFWSDPSCPQVGGHGLLVEVVYADSDVVYFARRFTRPQDEEVFAQHHLVTPVAFVDGTTEDPLVEIA